MQPLCNSWASCRLLLQSEMKIISHYKYDLDQQPVCKHFSQLVTVHNKTIQSFTREDIWMCHGISDVLQASMCHGASLSSSVQPSSKNTSSLTYSCCMKSCQGGLASDLLKRYNKHYHNYSAQRMQTTAKASNFNHKWSGTEIRILGLIPIQICMSAGSLSKCCGFIKLSASVISPSVVKIGWWLWEMLTKSPIPL